MNLEFHHVAVAVQDISSSVKKYELLGYKLDGQVYEDDTQGVKVCFLAMKGAPLIELVEPLSDNSPVNNILSKQGTTPYHFCYWVDDINEALIAMRKEKFVLLNKPVQAVAFNNKLICFLYNKEVGLIELVEK